MLRAARSYPSSVDEYIATFSRREKDLRAARLSRFSITILRSASSAFPETTYMSTAQRLDYRRTEARVVE
jgi:hypothetical protein